MQSADWTALRLSLTVACGAVFWITLPGVGLGWLLSRSRVRGRSLIETLVALPLVLPPVVTGFLVLILSSPRGPLGSLWRWLDISPAFTPYGAIIASGIVALPLLARSTAAGFAVVDERLISAAAGFGAGRWMIWRDVILPQARPALWSGIILAFGRALGEFGATVVVAGNIPGLTQTIPSAIYQRVQIGDEWGALRLVIIAGVLALATIGWATMLMNRRSAGLSEGVRNPADRTRSGR